MQVDLVVGGNGFLGRAVTALLKSMGNTVLSTSRNPKSQEQIYLDLEHASSFQVPRNVKRAIICSGISGKAVEMQPNLSQLINIVGTKILLDKLIEKNIRICFVSSSSVFNSEQNFATEFDAPLPRTLYGYQKLEIETFLSSNSMNFAIIRPTKILGLESNLFSMWKILSDNSKPLKINRDVKIAPIGINVAANIIGQISTNDKSGIFHLSASSLIYLNELIDIYELHGGVLGKYSIDFYSNEGEIPDSSSILYCARKHEWVHMAPQNLDSLW